MPESKHSLLQRCLVNYRLWQSWIYVDKTGGGWPKIVQVKQLHEKTFKFPEKILRTATKQSKNENICILGWQNIVEVFPLECYLLCCLRAFLDLKVLSQYWQRIAIPSKWFASSSKVIFYITTANIWVCPVFKKNLYFYMLKWILFIYVYNLKISPVLCHLISVHLIFTSICIIFISSNYF